MESHTVICKLLYQAMIDIRSASYKKKGFNGIFKLSDLFHNVPLSLNLIIDGKGTYDELLQEILEMAEMKGYDSWLKHTIKEINTHG